MRNAPDFWYSTFSGKRRENEYAQCLLVRVCQRWFRPLVKYNIAFLASLSDIKSQTRSQRDRSAQKLLSVSNIQHWLVVFVEFVGGYVKCLIFTSTVCINIEVAGEFKYKIWCESNRGAEQKLVRPRSQLACWFQGMVCVNWLGCIEYASYHIPWLLIKCILT